MTIDCSKCDRAVFQWSLIELDIAFIIEGHSIVLLLKASRNAQYPVSLYYYEWQSILWKLTSSIQQKCHDSVPRAGTRKNKPGFMADLGASNKIR